MSAYTVIQPQPTAEAPYVVADYPYGFHLRTQIRYWVETTKYGQKLVSQTRDPKSPVEKWNKPKSSTYSNIVLAALDSAKHVVNLAISTYSLEEAKTFSEKYGQYLSADQTKELTNMVAMLQVYSKVTYTVRTKKYKNVRTGEITTSVSMFDLADVVEVNDLGDPVDVKADVAVEKDITRAVNIAAVRNAAGATDFDSAMKTFKRSVS